MPPILRLCEDVLSNGAVLALPAAPRLIFVVHGAVTIGQRTLSDGEAWHGEGAATLAAGKAGAGPPGFAAAAGAAGAGGGAGASSPPQPRPGPRTIPPGARPLRRGSRC